MPKSNMETAKAFIEAFNDDRFDDALACCSGGCVMRGTPYVGLGIGATQDDAGRMVLTMVNPVGPSAGKLEVGDEILRVVDGDETWEGPERLKNGVWGLGVEGSEIELRIKRGGKVRELKLGRRRIEGYAIPLSELRPNWEAFAREWPDHAERVEMAVEDGDLVAILSVTSGTNKEYGRSATWGSTTFLRFQDGKIVELRGVEEELMQLKQLGYLVREPKKTAQV